jgi:tellurite resistance-related uncharacterized protein
MRMGIFKVWVTTETGESFRGQVEASSLAECIQEVIKKFGPKVRKTIVTPQYWYEVEAQNKEYQYGT